MTDSIEPTTTGAGTGSGSKGGPLIVVCLRPADPAMRVDPLTGRIDRDPGAFDLPAAEAAALEHALRVAGAWSGRVLAITAADETADESLRQVMALGAAVLRVPWPPGAATGGHDTRGAGRVSGAASGAADEAYVTDLVMDERALAMAMAGAVRRFAGPDGPALVLCGDRSAERGTGALPAFLAHELGAAQALGLVGLEPAEGHLLAERRLDGGRRERLRVPLPAVCSVEAAGVRLRRAGLSGVLSAASAVPPVDLPDTAGPAGIGIGAASVGAGRARPYRPPTRAVAPPVGVTPRERLLELSGARTVHEPPTVVGPVGAVEAADALLEFLRRTGHLPADLAEAAQAAEAAEATEPVVPAPSP